MASIISVNVKTRSLSANWDGKIHRQLLSVVDQGLEHDGYIVLTLDDKASLAAQVCVQVCMQILYFCCASTPRPLCPAVQ